MLSLPLSLVGVFIALLLTGDTLNTMSMIGIFMLLGLVTKNAILLVDHANERRAKGEGKRTALVEAGVVRLRPIIRTTPAMVLGMLPIAFAPGEGGGFRAPMARAVIGGLVTSTLLTLVLVPVAIVTSTISVGRSANLRIEIRPGLFQLLNGADYMETKTREEDVTGSRQRILAAALRIYGEHGFSGSTTRRIATEARVNEVTIFRQFGSKAALMAEAVLTPPAVPPLPVLPKTPGDPVAELHAWALSLLEWLRQTRTVIRRSFAETTAHPEVAGRLHSHVEAWNASLNAYVTILEEQGRITHSADTEIASSMLIAALLTDGLGRIELPSVFAVSVDESTARYVGAFLRLSNFAEVDLQSVQ